MALHAAGVGCRRHALALALTLYFQIKSLAQESAIPVMGLYMETHVPAVAGYFTLRRLAHRQPPTRMLQ